ncbi:MAG: 4Fe-4S binding protein [Candidatus Thorarchaeota archaeon]|nr:4Fe-4S binding protein [Candidatus Thorarchaeota archaeon]
MPIDKNFRTTWNRICHERPYAVWSSEHDGGLIYGSTVAIYIDACTLCMKCVDACPTNVFKLSLENEITPLYTKECILCLVCEIACPTDAIHVDRQGGSEETLKSLLGEV